MGRQPSGRWHLPRDTVETDNQLTRTARRRAKQMGADLGPTFFVPSFGVRRPVVISEPVRAFLGDLRSVLPRNYNVISPDHLALTVLEQRLLVAKFRNIDVQPYVHEIEAVKDATASHLRAHLSEGVPRKLPFALGRIARFGTGPQGPTKLGIEPKGWKNYNAKYADTDGNSRGSTHEMLPIPVIIRESVLCVGSIDQGLSQYDDEPRFGAVNPFNRTPHITIAQKQRGGSISESEASGLAGAIAAVLPDPEEFELFDPVINWKHGPGNHQVKTELIRSSRGIGPSEVPLLRSAG